MDPRVFSRNLATTATNENVLMAKSMNQSVQTPRKLPFKDATNNKGIELLKSAVKLGGSTSRVEKVQKQEPVLPPQQKESQEVLGFDFSEYVPPIDGDCYCCKENPKRVDEENWRKALAFADNFIANLLPDRLDEDFNEPMSPLAKPQRRISIDDSWMKLEIPKLPEPPVLEPFLEFDNSVNSGNGLDVSADSEPLEVPDFDDLDSSLQIPDFVGSVDDSIILDW